MGTMHLNDHQYNIQDVNMLYCRKFGLFTVIIQKIKMETICWDAPSIIFNYMHTIL